MSKLEHVFPLLAAIRINRKQDGDESESAFEENYSKWKDSLANSSSADIENVAHNIYADESKRTSDIENKGSWLLVGVGVLIAVLSIDLGFSFEVGFLIHPIIAVGIFTYSVFNLVSAIIGVHLATVIGKRHVLGTGDFCKTLQSNDTMLDWAAKQLAAIESNYAIIRKKSNLVSASREHFAVGLISAAVGFFLMFLFNYI